MRELPLTGPDGVRFVPISPGGTGVLVLAGSSGRVDARRAELLAQTGVVAESIRWFGGAGQNPGPWEIPLETFLDRVDDLRRDCDRIVVVGTSFGAEAALLTGGLSDQVDAVVAFAPTDVVWAGLTADGRMTSHWTHQGEPLPFVPYAQDWQPDSDPPAYRTLYESSREQAVADDTAWIQVERIPELLLVAGGDDQVWPAQPMAESIHDRRAHHGLATTLATDPEAGHRTILPGEQPAVGGVRMQRGGSEAADRRLGHRAWAELKRLW